MLGTRLGSQGVFVGSAFGSSSDDEGGIAPFTVPKLIMIAGQSNATGRADVGTTDRGLSMATTYTSALISQKTSDATTNPITWDFDYAARDLQPYRAAGNPGMGIELSAGRYLRDYCPIYAGASKPFLGKMSINGTALATWWLPTTPVDPVLPGGTNLLTQFVAYTRLKETESGMLTGAVIWIQGEADAMNLAQAQAYAANMEAFYASLKAAFGPTVRLIINKLHVDCIETYTSTVRAQQVAFAAGKPYVTLVDCDDIPLPAGDVHFAGDSMISLGNRLAEAAANAMYGGRDSNRNQLTGKIIQCVNEPFAYGVGDIKPRVPVHRAGDELYLVVATGLASASIAVPSGWTQLVTQQSNAGSIVNASVFRRVATSSSTPPPTIVDNNAYNIAGIFTVRGGTFESAQSTANNAYNSTVNIPAITPAGTNRLIVHIFAAYSGDPNVSLSGWTNANLTGLAEYRDTAWNVDGAGNGMMIAVAAGVRAPATSTGATTVTPSNISINCGITLAIA